MTTAASSVATAARPLTSRAMVNRLQARFGLCMVVANLAGGVDVFFFLGFILPRNERLDIANVVALVAYAFASVAVGCVLSARAAQPIREWVVGDRPLTNADREYLVRHPLRQTVINFGLWLGSEVVFVVINAPYGLADDADVAITILMGAMTTCGLTYLMGERILRPLFRLAFTEELPTHPYVPGVKSRLLLAWALGTGIPLLGVLLMAVDRSRPLSLGALTFLACAGLVSGAMATVYAAKSVAEPIESVTSALLAVEADRLDVNVPVYDGSQIGQLQHGFNTMVEGLRERRRLQDLFGRSVGTDVAKHALERGVRLGGEQVDVAVLFVDVIGSTELAACRPPAEVVAVLNQFFAVVVDVVDRTGGIVNKFEGDAALCVYGAPAPRADAATCALVAARLLRERLADLRGLSAAVGVSYGPVVAGNIGTRQRFEYTVIGDPVNEAARLTELAKTRPERLLACAAAVDAAAPVEQAHWTSDGEITLRGRTNATKLAIPA